MFGAQRLVRIVVWLGTNWNTYITSGYQKHWGILLLRICYSFVINEWVIWWIYFCFLISSEIPWLVLFSQSVSATPRERTWVCQAGLLWCYIIYCMATLLVLDRYRTLHFSACDFSRLFVKWIASALQFEKYSMTPVRFVKRII